MSAPLWETERIQLESWSSHPQSKEHKACLRAYEQVYTTEGASTTWPARPGSDEGFKEMLRGTTASDGKQKMRGHINRHIPTRKDHKPKARALDQASRHSTPRRTNLVTECWVQFSCLLQVLDVWPRQEATEECHLGSLQAQFALQPT